MTNRNRASSAQRWRRLSLLSLVLAACGQTRPMLEREPLVVAPKYKLREIMLSVGNQTVPFVLGTSGRSPSIPPEVAQRAHLYIRDHSKLGSSASSRLYYVDYDGQIHADLVAYSIPVRFPSGQSAKLDLQVFTMAGGDAQTGALSLQDLVNSGYAFTLDLSKDELLVADNVAAVAAFRAEHPDAQAVEFRSCGPARSVAVEINGVKTWLQLSTASTATFLNRRSPVLATMTSTKGKIGQVGGSMSHIPGLLLGQMALHLAGREFQADAVVLPTVSDCKDFEGELGMDVLQYCSFVWSEDALWMSCAP